jgi:putative transposase
MAASSWRALKDWAFARGVQLDFIRPGKPVENAFIEAFNGRLHDECVNVHQFTSIEDARAKIEAWRIDYNAHRPHSSLWHLTRNEFVAQRQAERIATAAGFSSSRLFLNGTNVITAEQSTVNCSETGGAYALLKADCIVSSPFDKRFSDRSFGD